MLRRIYVKAAGKRALVKNFWLFNSRLWDGRKHHLDKMTHDELVQAYFAHPAIQVYLILGVASAALTGVLLENVWPVVIAVAISPVIYALTWYVLHRFVLHGRFLYRSPSTAAVWKRVHFDHHQDPNDLGVLFGALYTTLPTIFIVTVSVGWLIGGPAAAAASFAGGLFVTCFYEYCHCVQHLSYTPSLSFLRRIKKLHLAHHFHNERGNFGITNFSWDRLFGTFYAHPKKVARSDTVFDLGYKGQEVERFPWVARLSTGGRTTPTEPS